MNVILRPFSFSGRAGRMEYIVTTLAALVPLFILFLLFFSKSSIIRGFGDGFLIFLMVYVIVMIWVCMAAAVRRNHDLNQSGAPGFLKSELLFRRGILGRNRFGSEVSANYSENIERIETLLNCGNYWRCTYNDEVAEVELNCVEMAAFNGGKCHQYYYYYRDRKLLFTVVSVCDYSVEYNQEDEEYIISFYDIETIEVKNDSCDPEEFEEFSAEWLDDIDDSDDDAVEEDDDVVDEEDEEDEEDDEEDDDEEDGDYCMRIFDATSNTLLLISNYEDKDLFERDDIYVYVKDKKINK